jgi:hypothetical protein
MFRDGGRVGAKHALPKISNPVVPNPSEAMGRTDSFMSQDGVPA